MRRRLCADRRHVDTEPPPSCNRWLVCELTLYYLPLNLALLLCQDNDMCDIGSCTKGASFEGQQVDRGEDFIGQGKRGDGAALVCEVRGVSQPSRVSSRRSAHRVARRPQDRARPLARAAAAALHGERKAPVKLGRRARHRSGAPAVQAPTARRRSAAATRRAAAGARERAR